MYTLAIGKLWEIYSGDNNTYGDLILPLLAWINNLPGTQISVAGFEEGIVDSVKSVSHSVIGNTLFCTILVSVNPTGPIVEELDE